MNRRRKSAQTRPETHGEKCRRLVGELHEQSKAWALAPTDLVWVFEGAADRVRRKAEEAKKATRKRGGE